MAVGGALSGAVASGTWEGAFYGAFTGLAFHNIGQTLGASTWAQGDFLGDYSAAGLAAKTVSHGITGGAITHMQGGRFGHGFLSSGVTAASSPYIATKFAGNRYAQGATAAIVGGTVSSATGGKFANGAVTAAMAYAFNQLGKGGQENDPEQVALDRYNALHEELRQRAINNPEGVLDLSGEEFRVIVDYIRHRTLRQGRFTVGSNEFDVHFATYDTFFHGNALLTGRQFNVGGSVIAEGGHINYIAVGMLAAHYGSNVEQTIPALVAAHNARQIYQGEGLRNVMDIGPGTRWALTGAALYGR